jgi:hypothetical protein
MLDSLIDLPFKPNQYLRYFGGCFCLQVHWYSVAQSLVQLFNVEILLWIFLVRSSDSELHQPKEGSRCSQQTETGKQIMADNRIVGQFV